MNVAVKADPQTSIVSQVEANPVMVLIKPETFEPFYAKIVEEVKAHVPDLSSKRGRDAIASLAFKVTKTKTAIDNAGKKLNEDARKQIDLVDASRRDFRKRLDALADEARKPLTVWEEIEDARLERVKAFIGQIHAAGQVASGETSADIATRIQTLRSIGIEPALFLDETDNTIALYDRTLVALQSTLERVQREESDRAELQRLRDAEAARLKAEAENAAREAAEARQKAEAEAAEQRRIAAEKAEQERIAAAEKRAEEAARIAAERKANEEREALERKHAAELRAEQAKAEEAERKRREEADRITREQADKDAETKRVADENLKRANDQAHRTAVKAAAKKAIMSCGADEETAKKVVMAIIAGEIPAVSILF